MMSEFSSIHFEIGSMRVVSTKSPFHGAAVSGCVTPAARAHANAFFMSASEYSPLFRGSYTKYAERLMLSGSLNTSHASTRRSRPNRRITPCTYGRSES